MTAPGAGPGDGLLFAYLKDALLAAGRALTVQQIADCLHWDLSVARRIAGEAAEAGLLDVSDGRYTLTGRGVRR